jgi:hypothetical protein
MELNHDMLNIELRKGESFVVSVLVLYFYSLLTKFGSLFVSEDSSSLSGFHQYLKRCIKPFIKLLIETFL